MGVYGCVCEGRVGIFGRKCGISRRILGVLGRMRAGCVGVEVEHLSNEKDSGVDGSVGRFFFQVPGYQKLVMSTEFLTDLLSFLFLPFSSSFLLSSPLVLRVSFFFLNYWNNPDPLDDVES